MNGIIPVFFSFLLISGSLAFGFPASKASLGMAAQSTVVLDLTAKQIF